MVVSRLTAQLLYGELALLKTRIRISSNRSMHTLVVSYGDVAASRKD